MPSPSLSKHARELLEETKQDSQRSAIYVRANDGNSVMVNGKELGGEDVDEAIRYRSAMDELVIADLARVTRDEAIELTAKGLDWKPPTGRVREV